jgi:hypothetical protein
MKNRPITIVVGLRFTRSHSKERGASYWPVTERPISKEKQLSIIAGRIHGQRTHGEIACDSIGLERKAWPRSVIAVEISEASGSRELF